MGFENLSVGRVVLHEVFKRRHDGSLVQPRYGTHLIELTPEARDMFAERVVDAMGDGSQSMQLDILESGPESAVSLSASLVGISDPAFVASSAIFADKLAAAQQSKSLPGGVVFAFSGLVGSAQCPFVAVIKAEKQSGFREQDDALQFLNDLFLTPASKLYKIGFFVCEDPTAPMPSGWKAFVYDSHMSTRNREGAAKYFYGTFLGCQMPENSAFLTRNFFNHTREFVRALNIAPETKDDLLTSLYTYLKVDRTPTIEVSAFSMNYMPTETRDKYSNYMQTRGFPTNAVLKDITDIDSQLRKRRVRFSGSIELSAPPESFQQLITIETIPADGAAAGQPTEWTRILIRDRIRTQE